VEIVREQTRKAKGELVACAGGLADFDESRRGSLRDAQGEAGGAAHEHMGRLAVDENGGRAVFVGPEISAMEFNFTEGQGCIRGD
jgi:hypothetical protein